MNSTLMQTTSPQTGFADFVSRTPGIEEGVVASADGLVVALSRGLPRDRADQLAALATGLASLAAGGSALLGGGDVVQTLVEMDGGVLFAAPAAGGGAVAVVAAPGCDLGSVGFALSLYAHGAPAH
ncbi:roadblock/LC7 domain-containing protein [Streptomyces sp. NBC_01264]|uniref:roadblock/LC7 domain-containing protein n=1 Tax=Streptomyces sp. NBC_01264 TaxID=2903804 RepID=UPI00224CABF5|nr:roadblock/LC7 domain-containing protein [Streptomyces sp. NBC_01264]MCX4781758.1 roadblock/LC7 domain-containing protein [Streptomyces sp. NBC_01264]